MRDEEIQPDTRTLSNLVFACLFTLLTCLWCCIRPDVPSPQDSRLRILFTKLNIIFWVLVSPEMVAFWSFRQWFEAGRIAEEFKSKKHLCFFPLLPYLSDRGWTRRHALFLLMGGFMLCENGQPIQTLSIPQFRRLLQRGAIDFPSTTISEIKERGSLHPTFAFLVILQVTWFTTQCLSRLAKGLVITQLEALTLVLLLMNVIILVFAYQKPLDARYPIQINIKFDVDPHLGEPTPRTVRADFKREKEIEDIAKRIFLVEHRSQSQPLMTVGHFIYHVLKFTFIWPIRSMYRDFGYLAINMESNEIPRGSLKVPFFYVPDSSDLLLCVLPAVTLLGVGVGVVSCLFWSWGHFPSDVARLVWRVSSVTTAAFCALFLVLITFISLTQMWSQAALSGLVEMIADLCIYVGVFIFLIALIPYIVARVIVLLESFVCLQSLPPEAFRIVPWTNYIPHFA